MCSVLLSVVYEHDSMYGYNFVWDEDVGIAMIALVQSEWLFELHGVSFRVAILVYQLVGECWGDIVSRVTVGGGVMKDWDSKVDQEVVEVQMVCWVS